MRSSFPVTVLLAFLAAPGLAAPPLFAPLTAGSPPDLPAVAEEVPSPAAFLGYPLGERFTAYPEIVAYLETLAAASERVSIQEYGRTYEGRPLKLVTLTSPRQGRRLEEIRLQSLSLASGELDEKVRDRILDDQPAVVWLAFGVHGNETSSAEAAMAVAYVLAAGLGEWEELLEHVVVVLDPLVNPDGREHWVSWYRGERGSRPDPFYGAAEHRPPWPGGRQNHYMIDLNRDWAWLTQVESRQRVAAYRRWEPQVYVDFHEMSSRSTYFFPPPADPVHVELDPDVLAWLEVFGRANATAFDAQGWGYFVRERYDLFYPGYGDTYPGLRRAVGMTYEVGGGGGAGLDLELRNGRRVNLADRVARHTTAALATVRTAGKNRRRLVGGFASARARRPALVTYLFSPRQAEGPALASLLVEHGLVVEELGEEATLVARALGSEVIREASFDAGTLAVSTDGPLGYLLRALMEPTSEMPEEFLAEQRRRFEERRPTSFYDITGWSLPRAMNLEVETVTGRPPGLVPWRPAPGRLAGETGVGFLVRPQGIAGYAFAAALSEAGVKLRFTLRELRVAGRLYPAGSFYVPARGNGEDLAARLAELAAETGVRLDAVPTSWSEEGPSLGSDEVLPLRRARVGLVGGKGVGTTSFGALWHLLDREVTLPYSRLDLDGISGPVLERLDVLVLPDGGGYGALDQEAVSRWVRSGGVLVAVGRAVEWVQQAELTEVKTLQPEADTASEGGDDREVHVPGAILTTEVSADHPLAAGLASPPPILFYGRKILQATGDPRVDVLVAGPDPLIGGFAWPEAQDRLHGALLVAAEGVGRGRVVLFAQEPVFRLFWRGTAPLFLNALMVAPSL